MPTPVLFIDSARGIGGAQLNLLEFITCLNRDKFRPYFLGYEGPLAERLRDVDVTVQTGSFPFFSKRRPWNYVAAIWRIVQLIRQANISIVHVNCDRAVPHVVRAGKIARVPVLCYIHDMSRAWFFPPYVRQVNRSERIVANSKATAQHCLEAGMDATKLQVIYACFNACDYLNVPSIDHQKLRQSWSTDDNHVVIGLVGQVLRHKGHETFIRAAHKIISKFENARFIIIGDDALSSEPEFLPEMKKLASYLGLEKHLLFAGFQQSIPAVMKALDIVAVPSWKEPFGRVVVEALASGRPMVASASGGIPEIVEDGVTGFLVPPQDADALAGALLQLCQNPKQRKQMGERGPASASRFDVEPHTRLFERTYEAILNGTTESLPQVPFGEPFRQHGLANSGD